MFDISMSSSVCVPGFAFVASFSGFGILAGIFNVASELNVAGKLDVASVFDLASVFAVAGVLCRICCSATSFLSSRISRKSSCALTMSHFIDQL